MYTVYKTVCLVNGKFYIGVHKTSKPMDDYLGSGKLLRRAIEKHGRENFRKEVLAHFEESDAAYCKEAELVTRELIESGLSYNVKLGGEGGFDYINAKGINGTRVGNATGGRRSKPSDKSISNLVPGWKGGDVWTGRKHSDETKRKISEAMRKKRFGSSVGRAVD